MNADVTDEAAIAIISRTAHLLSEMVLSALAKHPNPQIAWLAQDELARRAKKDG